jgi:hypothetical protein
MGNFDNYFQQNKSFDYTNCASMIVSGPGHSSVNATYVYLFTVFSVFGPIKLSRFILFTTVIKKNVKCTITLLRF